MKISIIVPIYNVEDFLDRCLTSIANQTYSKLEVILVNDGSTDSSPSIASSYVSNDARFQLIDQQNVGLSAARNKGLEFVTGDYVFYLDSDDYLACNALESLLHLAIIHKADIVQSNFYYDYPDRLLYDISLVEPFVIKDKNVMMDLLLEQRLIKNFAWGKLIKSELAKRFTFPVGKFFEDTFWKYRLLHEANLVVLDNAPLVFYLQRGASISGAFSIRNLDQLIGEGSRLDFIAEYYPHLYYKGKVLFFRNIIFHKNCARKFLKEDIGNKYIFEVERLMEKYNLFHVNSLLKHRYRCHFVDFLYQLYSRVIDKFSASSKFEIIEKNVKKNY